LSTMRAECSTLSGIANGETEQSFSGDVPSGWLVFTRNDYRNRDVFLMKLPDCDPTGLTEDPACDHRPSLPGTVYRFIREKFTISRVCSSLKPSCSMAPEGQTVEQLPQPLHRAVLMEHTCLPPFHTKLGAL
jgi:hypothetical protein